MHIFVDESGVFPKPSGKLEVISTLGALCIPTRRRDHLYMKFDALKTRWGVNRLEIKGSKLRESQVREALILLSKHDVRAKLLIFDSGIHTEADIIAHQKNQAQLLTDKLHPHATPTLRAEIEDVQRRILRLSMPLYVQLELLTELSGMAFQEFTLWHAMRDGRELEKFAWAIDAKDKARTEYENLWKLVIAPFLATRSSQYPLLTVEGADYSHMQRFYKPLDKQDSGAAEVVGNSTNKEGRLDIKQVLLEELTYPDSKSDLGIQLVDIVVTTLRRALAGTLAASGWQSLSKVLIHYKAMGSIPSLSLFPVRNARTVKRSYQPIVKWLHDNATNMIPPRLLREGKHQEK
jgi:hypothetical protein